MDGAGGEVRRRGLEHEALRALDVTLTGRLRATLDDALETGDDVVNGGASYEEVDAIKRIAPQYRYFAVIEYNTRPAVSGRGSAIFLHMNESMLIPAQLAYAYARLAELAGTGVRTAAIDFDDPGRALNASGRRVQPDAVAGFGERAQDGGRRGATDAGGGQGPRDLPDAQIDDERREERQPGGQPGRCDRRSHARHATG